MSETLTITELASRLVADAVWAPSVHNTQPWRFTAGDHQLSLHADPGRRLAVADPDGRAMLISCGAALFTTRLALRALGYIPMVRVLPDPHDPFHPYFPGRHFARGHGWGLPPLGTASAARSAGVVALLTTWQDRPADWVNAGQALQLILLNASAEGVAVALHSLPLELPWLREVIRTQFAGGACPQLVLRFGTVVQVAISVRRDPADVIFPGDGDREEQA